MMFRRWTNLPLAPHQARPVRVVGDGAIQSEGVADGRFLPVLIIDTTDRPDIVEHVRLHKNSGTGDVETTWCKLEESDVGLLLSFKAPTKTSLILTFNVSKQYSLIDLVVQSRGLYLQCGKQGDRLRDTLDKPKIAIEVAKSGFDQPWEKLLLSTVRQQLKVSGIDGRTAKRTALEHVHQMRRLASLRLWAAQDASI